MNEFLSDMLNNIVGITTDIRLTGEKDLIIKKEELRKRIQTYKLAEQYFDVMENEHEILERQGLLWGYIDDEYKIMFKIPDWDRLITAIHVFYISYQEVGDE